jgi:hypothetical protein
LLLPHLQLLLLVHMLILLLLYAAWNDMGAAATGLRRLLL